MAKTKELPELVNEFVGMSKDYIQQETLGRAKLLGRRTGLGMAAAGVASVAVLFLAVAGLRLLVDVMPGEPSHRMWSGLAYVLACFALLAIAGVVGKVGSSK